MFIQPLFQNERHTLPDFLFETILLPQSTFLQEIPAAMMACAPVCGQGGGYVASSILAAQLEQSFAETEARKQQRVREIRRWTWTVAGAAVASMVMSLTVMYMEASLICYLAFAFPLVTGPCIIIQRRRLNKLPRLVQQINLCRQLVNRMSVQNTRLELENNRLGKQLSHLEASEARLAGIAASSGLEIEELESLCRENSQTLKKMKQIQQAEELQSFLRAVLQSDTDNDRKMSEEELDRLSQRLQVFNSSRLPIDDGLLRKAFHMSGASGVSTTQLFKQTRDLLEKQEQLEAAEMAGEVQWA